MVPSPNPIRDLALAIFTVAWIASLVFYTQGLPIDTNVVATSRPLQLVYPDDDGHTLVINQTNMDVVMSWDKPIIVIAICGPLHSGKSFLANQIMLNRTDGFALGWTTEPKTRGLWMWSEPLIDQSTGNMIVFLDTEGLFASNVTEEYDSKIFAISSLLSSHLIYNTVKFVDQSSVDYIELLIRRSQLFLIKAFSRTDNVESSFTSNPASAKILKSVPSTSTSKSNHLEQSYNFRQLTWIVQDFVQEMMPGESATSWLHSILKIGSATRSGTATGKDVSTTSLISLFNRVDCFTLFIPDYRRENLARLDQRMKSEDMLDSYKSDLEKVKNHILGDTRDLSSSKSNHLMTGPILARYTEMLVDAANNGDFPNVPTAWEGFLNQQGYTAVETAVSVYNRQVSQSAFPSSSNNSSNAKNDYPCTKSHLEESMSMAKEYSMQVFKQITNGLLAIRLEYAPLIEQKIEFSRLAFVEHNNGRIQTLCSRSSFDAKQIVRMWEQNNVIPNLPMTVSKLDIEVKNAMKDSLQHYTDRTVKFNFSKSYSEYRDGVVSFARGIFDGIQMRNSRMVVDFANRVIEDVLKNMTRSLTRRVGDTMTLYELESFAYPAYREAHNSFNLKTYALLKDHPSQHYILDTLKSHIDVAHVKLGESNRGAVNGNVKQVASRISSAMVDFLDDIKLPQSFSNIESQLRSLEKRMIEEYDHLTSKFANVSSQYGQSRSFLMETFKSDCDELFKRNNFKLDRITKEIMPSLNLDQVVSHYGDIWYPYSTVAHIQQILRDEVKRSAGSSTDEDLVDDIVDMYLMKTRTIDNIYNKAMWSWTSLIVTLICVLFIGSLSYYYCCK